MSETVTNTDSLAILNETDVRIVKNICAALECEPTDITDVEYISDGDTNTNWSFKAKDQKYVYRHPSNNATNNLNREAEYNANMIAQKHGIDELLVFLHPTEYWKITRFIETSRLFDYNDFDLVAEAFDLIKRVNACPETIDHVFDIYQDYQTKKARIVPEMVADIPDYYNLAEKAERLIKVARKLNPQKVLCHNDSMYANLLVEKLPDDGEHIHLIDWEYAGMSDTLADLAGFLVSAPYDLDDTKQVNEIWFGRPLTLTEELATHGYTGFNAFYWLGWAILRRAEGNSVEGNFMNDYLRFARFETEYFEELLERARDEDLPIAFETINESSTA